MGTKNLLLLLIGIFIFIPKFVYADLSTPLDLLEWNGHYYTVFSEEKNWFQADEYALSLGGYLATITSEEENNWLVGAYSSILETNKVFWLGGYQDKNDPNYSEPLGGWKWITNESWSYTNWQSYPEREPNNNAPGGEHHLVFNDRAVYGTGRWNDLNGNDNLRGYFVEWDELPGGASPIPEPSTLVLLACGLLGTGVFKRKWNK